MRKINKKIIAVVSMVSLIMSLCACSSNEANVSTDDNTFTYWAVMDTNTQSSLKSYADMLFFQEYEKRTGIHIDFIHPIQGSTGDEAFMTMLSSKEIPDIMEYNWSKYKGGAQQAIDDGLIICLNDYLEEYAPNYYDYLEGEKGASNNYLYKLQAATPEGNYYGFNALSIGNARCFSGLFVRKDMLDKWGVSIPETIDEWDMVFAKAKEEGFEKPFTAPQGVISILWPNYTFSTAYDVGQTFYVEDGKIVYGPFQPGYKEYVAQLADWVKKGYLDTSYITNDFDKVTGNMVNGYSVAAWGYISTLGELNDAGRKLEPNYNVVACPYPVSEKGTTSRFGPVAQEATAGALAISADCENFKKAIEWCDYIYSDEGNVLRTFGIEGDTYTVEEREDGAHYVYTDKITDYEKSGVQNIAQALYKYMLPANHPGLNQHPDYLDGYYQLDNQKEALVLWNTHVESAKVSTLPTLSYTDEESREKLDITEIVDNDMEVGISNIILGKASIDTYDDIIKQAKEDGYLRVIEIVQTAYDRYISNSK